MRYKPVHYVWQLIKDGIEIQMPPDYFSLSNKPVVLTEVAPQKLKGSKQCSRTEKTKRMKYRDTKI